VWEDYLAGCGRPLNWYQRDFVHANSRGKQILGRIMERFFTPDRAPGHGMGGASAREVNGHIECEMKVASAV